MPRNRTWDTPTLGPLDPLFRPKTKKGTITTGNTPGTPDAPPIGIRSVSSTHQYGTSGTGTRVLNSPAGITAGDFLLFFAMWANSVTPSLPTGFTNIATSSNLGGTSHRAAYKWALGTEPPSYSISGASGGGASAFGMICVQGASGTIGPTSATGNGTATSPFSTTGITMAADGLILHWMCNAFSAGIITPTSGQTEQVEDKQGSPAPVFAGVWGASKLVTAGATGIQTMSSTDGSSIRYASGLVGLYPI